MSQELFLEDVENRFCPNPNDQIELFYRSWIPLKPRLVLLLIHGAGQHSGQFLDLGMYCLQHGIAFYALDLRGFGQSTGKRGHVNFFDEYLDDLDQFIRYLKKKHPEDPVFLLGYSLGGTIVIRYGQKHQNCIQGAILAAPAIRLRLRIPKYLKCVSHVLSRITPGLCIDLKKCDIILSRFSSVHPIFYEGLSEEIDPLSTSQFSVRWFNELLVNGYQALSKVSDFKIPVFCFCGADDEIIDPASVQEFYDFLQVKDKKYILFPHTKHELLWANEKERIYKHIVNWLKVHI